MSSLVYILKSIAEKKEVEEKSGGGDCGCVCVGWWWCVEKSFVCGFFDVIFGAEQG